ncbi:hypothetical protein AB0D11_02295 [Streptomyces monashensis]|uniref:hypothetical protein n=1 Tax=Streptomyces monashensis TaxID=1678012 RepID=UPI00340B536F
MENAAHASLGHEQHPTRPETRNDPSEPSGGSPETHHEAPTPHTSLPPRPNTPDRINEDGSKTITTKRACNGCGQLLGDITDQEMALAVAGGPMPDVRRECPTCAPTAPEPVCRPMQIVAGDALCLEVECDHDLEDGAEYCVEVAEEVVCSTHSEISNMGEITHVAPWPCKHSTAVAS